MASKITYTVGTGTDRKVLEAEVDDEQSLTFVLDLIRACCSSGGSTERPMVPVAKIEIDLSYLPDAETLSKALKALKGLRPPPTPRQPDEDE